MQLQTQFEHQTLHKHQIKNLHRISLPATSLWKKVFLVNTHSVGFRALPNILFSLFSSFLKWEKDSRFAFHRRKFNLLMKELCRIAFGAVSTCFIYSSAFQEKFRLAEIFLLCFTHKWICKACETHEGKENFLYRIYVFQVLDYFQA